MYKISKEIEMMLISFPTERIMKTMLIWNKDSFIHSRTSNELLPWPKILLGGQNNKILISRSVQLIGLGQILK